jgi:hypothetical protein
MIAALLCLLALIDATLCGFRAAAGRSGLIDKRAYYQAAMWRGLFFGLGALALFLTVAGLLLLHSRQPEVLWRSFMAVGQRALWIYGPYTILIFFAISLWAMPWIEMRILATVLILGPFTLIRPYVVALGLIVGVSAQVQTEVLILAFVIAGVTLYQELGLGWRYENSAAKLR